MANVSSSKGWIQVKDGSKFTLTTSAQPPNVEITVVITTDTGSTTTWTSADVLNQTKSLTIRSPRRYHMAITMVFAGAKTTLDVDARIEKPNNGGAHGKPFRFKTSPPKKIHHADISIITK